jgi:hypothetical protein
MMALLIFSILSLIASTLVIFAAALSSQISRHEDWTETYDSTESSNPSKPLHAQMVNQ